MLELSDAREVEVGGARVRRALPRRGLRTVGAWCFADHMGPERVTEHSGLDVGPHPHMGLQTLTWLVDGAVLHHDSLGTEQLIRPGEVNLMTAGAGISHAEESSRVRNSSLEGIQLWIAQPDRHRNGGNGFEHHSDLPVTVVDRTEATVFAGSFADASSAVRAATEVVGVDALVMPGTSMWPLRADFEYAVYVVSGVVDLAGTTVREGQLLALGDLRDSVEIMATTAARVILLGGEPLREPLFMWWNFVGRSKAEVAEAVRQWNAGDERFGRVASSLPRIPAPML